MYMSSLGNFVKSIRTCLATNRCAGVGFKFGFTADHKPAIKLANLTPTSKNRVTSVLTDNFGDTLELIKETTTTFTYVINYDRG